MGRDITGVRVEHKSPPYASVIPKVSSGIDREINRKSPEGNNEGKDFEVKEITSEVPRAENSLEEQNVLDIKSSNFKVEKPDMKLPGTGDQMPSPPVKSPPAKAAVGNTKGKNTPQKPTDVTVDKQVYERPMAVETPVSPAGSNMKSPSSSKKSQPSTPYMTRKNLDDEDNWSMLSSAASVQTTRSRATVGIAPTFTVEDRLQKRKEYYTKLEEKRKALEAEKREYETRTKEEEEAAIKQLRRNMVFRANPVPNFYYEKPPPKKELKKLPTTRAVSPKFNRRKSCSDAVCRSSEEKPSAGSSRLSLCSQQRQQPIPASAPRKKDQLVGSSATSKVRERSRQVKDQTAFKTTHPKISKHSNSDVTVSS